MAKFDLVLGTPGINFGVEGIADAETQMRDTANAEQTAWLASLHATDLKWQHRRIAELHYCRGKEQETAFYTRALRPRVIEMLKTCVDGVLN